MGTNAFQKDDLDSEEDSDSDSEEDFVQKRKSCPTSIISDDGESDEESDGAESSGSETCELHDASNAGSKKM